MIQDRWIEGQVKEICRREESVRLEAIGENYEEALSNNFDETVHLYSAVAKKIESIREAINQRELRRAMRKLPHPSGEEFGKTIALYYSVLDREVKKQLPVFSKINELIEAEKKLQRIQN